MKTLSVIVIFVSLLVSTFSRSLLFVDYQLNTARYLAACINKAKPKLKCNGRCQLAQKIQEEEQQEQQNPAPRNMPKEEVFCSGPSFAVQAAGSVELHRTYIVFNNNTVVDVSLELLHPPPPLTTSRS